jgi:hypothetical protein
MFAGASLNFETRQQKTRASKILLALARKLLPYHTIQCLGSV